MCTDVACVLLHPLSEVTMDTKTKQPNEGEGNTTAARNYDKATEKFIKSGRVEKSAEEAKRAVDGPEGDALRKAEEKGKRG